MEKTATFSELGLSEVLTKALSEVGFDHPFPIQEMAIPIALSGADIIGQARTGTGKTLAFGLPLLDHVLLSGDDDYEDLSLPDKPQALILTPTRELASQVTAELSAANKYRQARLLTVYGGVGYDDQVGSLNDGIDIVIGTPGRILDLADSGKLDLAGVVRLVLDEADEMLDMGFLPDVERILSKTSTDRQSQLFSATMPGPIMALARAQMHQPVHLRAEGQDATLMVPETTQFVYQTHDLDKPEILGKLCQVSTLGKMMVFTQTKRSAARLADELVDRGFAAVAIHGDLTQQARERSLRRFRKGDAKVLVATDVAGRGIDVSGVTHVVNFECPDDEKTYVHRIGRTGRAGASGVAITFIDWADTTRWKVINRALELPFDEIVESYSTTPQLLSDLKIPEGVKGRLASPKPRPPRQDRDRREQRQSIDFDDQSQGGRRERARRQGDKTEPTGNRQRRRTRNGKPI